MGQKRGRAEGSFVRETRTQAVSFYRDLVQNLKAWQAPAPQLRPQPQLAATPPISPPDLLPLLPADHMLPPPAEERLQEADLPDGDQPTNQSTPVLQGITLNEFQYTSLQNQQKEDQ